MLRAQARFARCCGAKRDARASPRSESETSKGEEERRFDLEWVGKKYFHIFPKIALEKIKQKDCNTIVGEVFWKICNDNIMFPFQKKLCLLFFFESNCRKTIVSFGPERPRRVARRAGLRASPRTRPRAANMLENVVFLLKKKMEFERELWEFAPPPKKNRRLALYSIKFRLKEVRVQRTKSTLKKT